jgi:HlyD family secretion protein
MLKSMSKTQRILIVAVIVVAVGGFFGYKYWKSRQFALPKGIASGNGRIEAKLADVAAKEPLRVLQVLVDEGDLVQPGQVLVQLDTSTLESQLGEAKASVLAAQERLTITESAIVRRKSEIELAKTEVERARKLVEERAGSQREYDVRKTALESTQASLAEEEAKLQTAKQEVVVAEANVVTVQTRITDATLTAPMMGRVLYRLAEPGEVLSPGGPALTIVNLDDVYMEIFLPAAEASKVKIGAEARLTVDYEPNRSAPAYVTFVSPEAQFTPKQVETRSERDKLMFRVKLQVPPDLVKHYIDRVKTGVRGVGYVKVDDSAVWPQWLEQGLLRAPQPGEAERAVPPATDTAPAASESTTTSH